MSASPSISASLSQARRAMGRTSLRRFMQIYLPLYCAQAFGSMHGELFDLLETATVTRRARIAIAAPRGHAKSTIVSLAYILWCVCYGLEDYIVLVSNTADQACDGLSHLKKELEDNELLVRDFPECCETARPGPVRWTKEEAITASGVKISALGAKNKIRGRRHRNSRPGLIILDDVENETEVRSSDQRLQLEEWFNKAVEKAGSGATNIVVVGTILHFDSLLAHLTDRAKKPGWTGKIYRAVETFSPRTELWQVWENLYNELAEDAEGRSGPAAASAYFQANAAEMLAGTKVLWPARESYVDLMEIRVRDGRASFDCEKQNNPVDPATCFFPETDFHYWDDQFESPRDLLKALGPGAYVYGACDPSMGKAGKNRDDSAILIGATDYRGETLYLLAADIARRKPDRIIEQIIQYHREWKFTRFGIESVQFQEFLVQEACRRARAAGLIVPFTKVQSSMDKTGRIQKLQPFIASGRIRLSKRFVMLLEQLRQFPHAAHDDGPDALEMLTQFAFRPPVKLRSVVL